MKLSWHDLLLGPAKDPLNPGVFHTVSLAAFFAWVGLGADGLSSSCYGPEEAFKHLHGYHSLALPLAAFMAFTVFLLSGSYSLLIGLFPGGGGGYMATTKLLGKTPGVVCGCALILDYILTIAISISAGVDALFSYLPPSLGGLKLYASLAVLGGMVLLNLRGVKESVVFLLPIFLAFLVTHLLGIGLVILGNVPELVGLIGETPGALQASARAEGGWLFLLAIFFRAFSLGGGTYTGIEAVSNSMQILREPRAATGKRTMLYMAISLALTASGLLVGYVLLKVEHQPGRTLNAVLFDKVFGGFRPGDLPVGSALAVITLLSEGALLFVAAQAGFIGGPRTLATMALDRWVPTRFSQLSSRLVIQDGVLFMSGGALLFIAATGASTELLVILYSINVFLTFTLSQLGMCVHWLKNRARETRWRLNLFINGSGTLLTALVLLLMVSFKFMGGGWVTLLITSLAVLTCFLVKGHYENVRRSLRELDILVQVPQPQVVNPPRQADPLRPTAALLVSGYNGLGAHSLLAVLRHYPGHFRNFLFISVGVVDFEEFSSKEDIDRLRHRTEEGLEKYVERARALGLYSEYRYSIGTDLVDEIEKMAVGVTQDYPGTIFFGGQLVFERENIFTRSLHSQSAFEIQRRLQFLGLLMVLLPVRVRPTV